jgi:hypothetical protein
VDPDPRTDWRAEDVDYRPTQQAIVCAAAWKGRIYVGVAAIDVPGQISDAWPMLGTGTQPTDEGIEHWVSLPEIIDTGISASSPSQLGEG